MRFSTDSLADEAYFDGVNRDIRDAYDPIQSSDRRRIPSWALALRGGAATSRIRGPAPVTGPRRSRRTYLSAGLGYAFNDQFTC
jgi:hypothetical protein